MQSIRLTSVGELDEKQITKISDVSKDQWTAFLAAFFGWLLDGFDFSILTFLLIDVQHSFTVDRTLAGALGSVTLIFRLAGGLGGGTLADRFGRKLPLILSIVWISIFSLLSGFSATYLMLFICRALFGIGMGGVWAAGLPLVLEHWPMKMRGLISGILVGGFAWGYMLAAFVFSYVYPLVSHLSIPGWRFMFWFAASPVLLVFWIRSQVSESPIWLAHRMAPVDMLRLKRLSIVRIFQRDLIGTTIQTAIILSVFMISYYSMTFWYPTFLRELKLSPLRFLIALNFGGVLGTAFWGRISETRLGRRGTVSLGAVGVLLALPLFLSVGGSWMLPGAFFMGFFGIGLWGIAPLYLAERFPTQTRAVGSGFAYHAGAAVGSLAPAFIGHLQDEGFTLVRSMTTCIGIATVFVALIIWIGPETRGRSFATGR